MRKINLLISVCIATVIVSGGWVSAQEEDWAEDLLVAEDVPADLVELDPEVEETPPPATEPEVLPPAEEPLPVIPEEGEPVALEDVPPSEPALFEDAPPSEPAPLEEVPAFEDEEEDDVYVAEGAPTEAMAELIELTPEEGMPGLAAPDAPREGLISVTLDSVPLQDVVRMFARISGANIVSGTNLIGTVTVSLKDVEWQPALRTILDTAGMTLVMKSPGIYSVVSKSEAAAAPVTIDTIQLRFTTVSNVLPVVQRMLVSSNSSVAAFPSANSIIVQETSERLAVIKDVVERIDRPRPQVFIEAKFVELNDEAIKNLGINWQSLAGYTISARDLVWAYSEERNWDSSRVSTWNQLDSRQNIDTLTKTYDIDGILNNSQRSVVDTIDVSQDVGLDISDSFTKSVADVRAAVLSAADFEVTLSALKQETGVSVVSNPRVLVASGETAKIHVGRKDPNYVTRQEPGASAGTVITRRELSETLPFVETGVRVDVRPTVNTETNITLKIIPELSRILAVEREGDLPPIITRTITSEFNLESGKTVAIGGLTSSDDREVVNKVPLLGDIPLIGKYLFRHTRTERVQDEVIIFVTVGLASAESLHTSVGIPSGGRLIHRHMALEATRQDSNGSSAGAP
jgi:type II secretory pathway component GspD/PulD (secretin)